MRVECHISPECDEPYTLLHIAHMTPRIQEAIALLEAEETEAGTLAAKRADCTYFLQPSDLELVRMEGGEAVGYDLKGQRYVLRGPLYELERTLGYDFVRISKSAVVNIRRLDHVEASLSNTMRLVTKSGIEDYISRSFRKSFRERLGL